VTTTDIVLLVIGALVAVTILVRMMLARRDQLVAEVQQQLAQQGKNVRGKKPSKEAQSTKTQPSSDAA
jgi:hypothetical protein